MSVLAGVTNPTLPGHVDDPVEVESSVLIDEFDPLRRRAPGFSASDRPPHEESSSSDVPVEAGGAAPPAGIADSVAVAVSERTFRSSADNSNVRDEEESPIAEATMENPTPSLGADPATIESCGLTAPESYTSSISRSPFSSVGVPSVGGDKGTRYRKIGGICGVVGSLNDARVETFSGLRETISVSNQFSSVSFLETRNSHNYI